MVADFFGIDGAIALVVCAVILFGSNRLPKFVKNIGLARREFLSIKEAAHPDGMSAGEESKARGCSESQSNQDLGAAVTPGDFDVQRATAMRKI